MAETRDKLRKTTAYSRHELSIVEMERMLITGAVFREDFSASLHKLEMSF
jgi:hypothetical protein